MTVETGTGVDVDGAAAVYTYPTEWTAVSTVGDCFENTPMVVLTRGHLDSIGRRDRNKRIGRASPRKQFGSVLCERGQLASWLVDWLMDAKL